MTGPARFRAGASAFALDALLVAYAGWALAFLASDARSYLPAPFDARPAWFLLAPLLAAAWRALPRTLGLSAYGLKVEPALPRARAARAASGAVLTLVLLVALWAGLRAGAPWVGAGVTAAALLALGVVGLATGRTPVDRLSGTTLAARTTRAEVPPPLVRRVNAWAALLLVVLTLLAGARIARLDLGALTDASEAGSVIGRLMHPDPSVAGVVVEKLIETVFLALMASVLAVPVAFVLSFLGARNVTATGPMGRVVYGLTRLVMNVTRSIEPLIWAIIFTVWVGVGPFAGVLALFVHSVAALGKLYSEAIESIDPGPVEGIRATGARELQVLRYGVVPQVVPPFLSFTVYRWDINVRMATILGLVGGGGIGGLFLDYSQLGVWSKVGTVIVGIALVVWMMDTLSSRARRRLV